MTANIRSSQIAQRVFGLNAWTANALLILCCLLGAAWSGQAQAIIGCEIQPNSPTSQIGPGGSTLTYSFNIVSISGGCAATVSGTVIPGSDTTGGASATPLSWSGSTTGGPVVISVTLGSNPGGTADFVVDCPASDCSGGTSTINWTAQVEDAWTLNATTAINFTVITGQTVPLGVQYLVNGAASTLDTLWSVDSVNGNVNVPAVTPDASGNAANFFFSYTPGTYVVTAEGACPIVFFRAAAAAAATTTCPPTPVTFTITVEAPALSIVTPAGGSITIPSNTPTPLEVRYAGPTVPVADGTAIDWTITSEPALGAGLFSPTDGGPPSFVRTTTTNGNTTVDFSGTLPGVYTVQAGYCPDGCTDTVSFTITVAVLSADLSVLKIDTPDPVVTGGALSYTVTLGNSGPDSAVSVALNDVLPAAVTFASLASPGGWTCTTPAVGAGGTVNCTAPILLSGGSAIFMIGVNVGVAISGGTIISNSATASSSTSDPNSGNNSATASTTVASSPGMSVSKLLTGTSDNDSSGSVTPGDQLDYSVTATNTGNVPLSNVLVSDDHFSATTSCASVPVTGTCVLTGSYVVQQSDASAGSITNIGSATSTQVAGPITNSVITAVSPTPAPAMTVTKLLTGTSDNDSSGLVTPGDQLDYSVTATNTGNVPLSNVLVSDDHFSATSSCASLPVSGTCVLTGSYVVLPADASAGSVSNIGSATSTQLAGPITDSVTTPVFFPVVRTLTIVSGNDQFGGPGTTLALPLVARALNDGVAAAGVSTTWTVTIGSATLGSATITTNAAGEASNSLTLGATSGPVTIRVSRADAPTVIVVFTANAAELSSLSGLDPRQRAIADVLDAFCPQLPAQSQDPEVLDLKQRCQDLFRSIGSDPAGVADALDQLFSDVAIMQSELGLLAAQAQFDNIKARIAALRSGTRGTSFGGLALNAGGGRLPIGAMLQNMLNGDQAAEKEVGTDFSRWGFFAAGTIGRGNADAGSLSPSYDFDINGLTVGADYRKSDKLIFGGSLGYTKQDSELAGDRGNLDASGWSASAYGTFYQADSWYSDAVLSYGRNSYQTERRLRYSFTLPGGGTTTIDQLGRGDSSGDSLTLAASFGRDFNKNGWGFGPYFRAMYTRLGFDAVTEELDSGMPGSGLALAIDAREVTSLSSTLGGKLTYAHSASWGVMIPHVQFEWQHEFKTDPSAVEAHFLYDPTATPFSINGDQADSDFFRFGVGMSFVMTRGRSGFFYYERLISRERFSQNSLAFGLRLEF